MILFSCNFVNEKEIGERSIEGWDSGVGVVLVGFISGEENKEFKYEFFVFILCCILLFKGIKLCVVFSYRIY